MPFGCRDNLHSGSTSDSSSGESSSGQWPKRGPSLSHVRFEDESAREAESRYLERLQQRQRQVLSPALQMAEQGPLRSKPELADYMAGGLLRRDAGERTLHRLVGHLDLGAFPERPPTRGVERTCRACGSCIEDLRPSLGKAARDPKVLQEHGAACGLEGVSAEPLSSWGLSAPCRLLPAEQGPRTERARETRIADSARLEEVDSALDSTDTSDSCRTDSEEAGTSQPLRVRGPRLRGSRPRGGHRWCRQAEREPPESPPAPHNLPEVDLLEVSDEVKEGRGHTPEGTLFPRENPYSKPPVQEPEGTSLGPQGELRLGLGNHWAASVDSSAPSGKACAPASFVKLAPLGPGRQDQVIESHQSLETIRLQQSHAEPSAPHQAQPPMASLSSEGWVPTPPPPRKTASPGPHRKALRRPSDQGESGGTPCWALPSGSVVPRTCELSPPQTQPCSHQGGDPLLGLSTNNCNNSEPGGLRESSGVAVLEGRVEKGTSSQEPEAPLENCRGGKVAPVWGSLKAEVKSVVSHILLLLLVFVGYIATHHS